MAFYLKRIIFHNRAPFEHLDLEVGDKGVLLLSGLNGGGKTTVLSHITDAFYELAKPFFHNEFAGKENKFYRVSSPLFNLDPSQPSFVYFRFGITDDQGQTQSLDYVDIQGSCSEPQYNQAIGLPDKMAYSVFARTMEDSPCTKVFSRRLSRKEVEKIFATNVLTFFPAYRFDFPAYLNDCYKQRTVFDKEASYIGFLPNPIEATTSFSELVNWMMDVLLDWQVNKKITDFPTPSQTKISIDLTPEKTRIWDSLNDLINLGVVNNDGGRLRLGVGRRMNPSQRMAIMRDNGKAVSPVKYPSIFNISSGEMALLTLFGEILRQADVIGVQHKASGIVLVDEVDKHLHIKLQKEVLPKLFAFFPNIQFIVSSHSPFVSMGLAEQMKARASLVHLDRKSGLVLAPENNPLYEEVYQMLIRENENYKKAFQELMARRGKERILVVEDEYDQIYKIAWLKLKGIAFDEKSIDSAFQEYAPFTISSGYSASGVAGLLNARNTDIFNGLKIVGLFDFDHEGSEKFFNLSEGFGGKGKEIKGDLLSGFYRRKESIFADISAMLIPIPERLHNLILGSKNKDMWSSDAKFENHVEIEVLLPESLLDGNPNFEKEDVGDSCFFKAKDTKKNILWKDLVDQLPEAFNDFHDLFVKLYELLGLPAFD